MKQANQSRLLLSAVAAALCIMGWNRNADAQYRVGTDGRANEANNRIGSGGYNSGADLTQRELGASANQVITGNVTGLSYFHGSVPYNDPNVRESGTQTGASDRFLAISGPVNYNNRTTGAATAQPFYSTASIAAPPAGNFMTAPGNGALLPAPVITNRTADTRLGMTSSVVGQSSLPKPGEFDLPGPVDTSGNASALTASPLYGVRAWSPNDASDAYFLSRYTNIHPEGPGDRGRLDNVAIQQMRNELNSTMLDANGQPANPSQNGANANGTAANGAMNANAVSNGAIGANPSNNSANGSNAASNGGNGNLGAAQNSLGQSQVIGNRPLTQAPLNSAVANQPVNGAANSEVGMQQRLLTLVNPEDQTPQLRDLEQRLAQQRGRMSNEDANRAYNQERLLNEESKKAVDAAANPSMNPNGAGTGSTEAPGASPTNAAPGADGGGTANYAPGNDDSGKNATTPPLNPVVTGPINSGPQQAYIITSLATGVKAKGLANLLSSAEEQMRQGKFTGALDIYDSARQVAPNNPFISLGRGFAELGASYYGKAEADLRQSFAAQPAVLAGQYDLKGFLGEDRLKFVVKDLKEIKDSEKSERPAFLLAYISHNVGDDENAAKYLDETEQRAGGNDPIVRLMRETWGLKKQ